ncbi:tetratricopeptide repeat-containing protein, partial [Cryptosporidium felis]
MTKDIQSLVALSTRDQQQFKTIVQLYDQRIYKRALKLAETMLKKYPKQGDLLSMKAFILGALHPDSKDKRRTEAYECAKEAIKHNIKNPMSWHCLGTLYRNDFDYSEAIKCFKTALKFDKEDLVVLRDLATCFIQLRNYHGFREIRNEMKRIRPDVRTNWIASALGNHFCGYINSAINCLVSIDKFGRSKESSNQSASEELGCGLYEDMFSFLEPFQRSELLLYFARVLIDGKKFQEAYKFLRSNKDFILDKTDYLTVMGNLLLSCGENYSKECSEYFERLLELYPDDDFALFGCMLSDASLGGIVLPPRTKGSLLIQEKKCHEGSSGTSQEGVLAICGISSEFYHLRGTSGIMYYPIMLNEEVVRNESLRERKLSSKELGKVYGYKNSSRVRNEILEFVHYDDQDLRGFQKEYQVSLSRLERFFEEKKSKFP